MTAAAPRSVALNVAAHPDGGSQLGVIAKRTYHVRGGMCAVADQQVALVEVPRVPDDKSVLLHDIDVALNRRVVDVVVVGKAHPPARGATAFDIRVRVGALDRRVRAIGSRQCWRDATGHLRFSDPGPIEAVDLGWASAYGGVDHVALRKFGCPIARFQAAQRQPYNPHFGLYAYPRNRVGKGFLIESSAEALARCALPNLEDPDHLLTPDRITIGHRDRWPGAPLVAGLGWLSYNYFPRVAAAGLMPLFDAAAFPPESFPEVRAGALGVASLAQRIALNERVDMVVAQQSAVGMRIPELVPGAPVQLEHLHAQHAVWAFNLPWERPHMALQLPDQAPLEPTAAIRTVLLEPEHDRVCVTWVAEHRELLPVGPGKAQKIRYAARWAA